MISQIPVTDDVAVQLTCLEGFAVRTLRVMSLLGWWSLASAGSGWAQTPQRPQPLDQSIRVKVSQLIESLDADQRAERIRAERELRSLGPGVLSVLPDPRVLTSESARVILRQLRIELERQRARASVQASSVSLSGPYTVAQALTAVTAQTGNQIDVTGLNPAQLQQRMRFPEPGTPETFWPFLDELSGRFGWKCVAGESGRQAVRLIESSGSPGRIAYSGPVRVVLVRSVLQPVFGAPGSDKLRCKMELYVEPRLRPLFLRITGQSITAQSQAGVNFRPLSLSGASLELPLGHDRRRVPFHVDFIKPQAESSPRFSLRGDVSLQLAAAESQFRFAGLRNANNVARRRNGVTVVLRRATFKSLPDQSVTARVTITVVYDAGGPPFESHRTWIFHNAAHLVSAVGRRLTTQDGFQIERQSDGGVQITFIFRGLEPPATDCRFVYVAPTLITKIPVRFRFADVPLRP
ncbi:MAG: hypothetical protein ABGZ17_27805, partial [Planctomycetaceae bacterium]